MRSFAIVGAVLVALSVGGAAADAPSLIGNWTRTAYSSAQVGESTGYPASSKPTLTHGTDQDWEIKIEAQDGNSFSGKLTGPTGKPQTIVGAFRQDGKRFVFSTDTDFGRRRGQQRRNGILLDRLQSTLRRGGMRHL